MRENYCLSCLSRNLSNPTCGFELTIHVLAIERIVKDHNCVTKGWVGKNLRKKE